MAMISRLLIRVVLIAFAVLITLQSAEAQYSMSLRFDTVTANPGDTVNLNVYYKFTSGLPKSVQDFNLRFEYDTNEVYAFDYTLSGTAADSLFVRDDSHHGIIVTDSDAYTFHSLDFTNPILCKIRFRVSKRLADSAFIRWDTGVSVFEYSDSINTSEHDGLIRTPSVAGHVILANPEVTVDTGKSFQIPISISGIENAKIDSALLRFEVDTTRLPFREVFAGVTSNAVVSSSSASGDTVSVVLKASEGFIMNSDTMITIAFYSIPWYDTACVMLSNVRLLPLNAGSLIGNTASSTGSICIVPGSKPPAGVNTSTVDHGSFWVYPNPARDEVTFDADGNSSRASFEVYDLLGRRAYRSIGAHSVWQIPAGFQPGLYFVKMDTEARSVTKSLIIEP